MTLDLYYEMFMKIDQQGFETYMCSFYAACQFQNLNKQLKNVFFLV